MPIEVKELIIRATVEDKPAKGERQSKPKPQDTSALVEECVEQVLEILRKERER